MAAGRSLGSRPTFPNAPKAQSLWARWVAANSASEGIGLGAAALSWTAVDGAMRAAPAVIADLSGAITAVLVGTLIEGALVGWLQWLVLRRAIPAVKARTWVLATTAGALAAWFLGVLPMALASAQQSSTSTAPEPSAVVIYPLAALMGLALGPVLGVPQWLVLRRHVNGAGWWVPANSLAWAPGMVLVFVAAGSVPPEGFTVSVMARILFLLTAAGAAVGAVHGIALVRLTRSRNTSPAITRI